MKKITTLAFAAILAVSGAFFAASCTTTTTDTGYYMAQKGQTRLTYSAAGKDSTAVKNAVLNALSARGWRAETKDFPIAASIDNRGQSAKVSITFDNGEIAIETKGSTIDGKAYVPIRYVDYLMKTVNKYLH